MSKRIWQIMKHLLRAAGLIFIIISLNFFLIQAMPGDPLVHILGEEEYFTLSVQYPEKLEEVKEQYSLDGSVMQQYARYIYNVATLNFGHSYVDGTSVAKTVLFRMRWTLALSLTAITLSAIIGGALGILAGYKKGQKLDSVLTAIFLFLETIPANCLALITLVVFSYKLKWFPVGGMVSGGLSGLPKFLSILEHMILPVTVLTLFRTSTNFLMMKSFVSQIREQEYILMATAKGLTPRKVLFRHLMRNVTVPFVTTLGIQFGHILSGAMLVEVVFSWKGMGTLIYEGVMARDYPTVQLCLLLIAVCVILFNFISDIVCMYLDPRIRDGAHHHG